MRYDFLMHYGVKGMRWKNRKAIIDPSNTDIRVKKADNTPRIEKEKNLVLSGTGNKKFATSEREIDYKNAREELNSKIEQAEQEDREAREEAARLAYEASLKKAKERAGQTKKEVKSETKAPAVDPNKFKLSNERDRAYTAWQNAKNKAMGINQVNVMNDVSKNKKTINDIVNEKKKKT